MLKHKVSLLGAFGVGKTSLVQRFVTGIFSERYHTTIGVRIDKREVSIGQQQVLLMVWDLQGEDDVHTVPFNHVRGSSAFFVVADGTREHTIDTALRLREQALEMLGDVPCILLINKEDLSTKWQVTNERLQDLAATGLRIVRTSAKTGSAVAIAFEDLTRTLLV